MANKKFHQEPFDEGTLTKLRIFREHLKGWLGVYLARASKGNVDKIQVCDLFSGPGEDSIGNQGSPLIIVEEVSKSLNESQKKGWVRPEVNLIFSDSSPQNVDRLRARVRAIEIPRGVTINISCASFEDALGKVKVAPRLPRYLFLDQFGIKDVNKDTLRSLANITEADILFFIPSSFILRFAETKSFQKHIGIPAEDLVDVEPEKIHRYVVDQWYRQAIPKGTNYYIAPFSIKKGSNMYGLVFGSHHLRGLEKFLEACWKVDPESGQANSNVDGDFRAAEGELPFNPPPPKKELRFTETLCEYLRSKERTNHFVTQICLEHGFLPKHGSAILRSLDEEGKLEVLDRPEKGSGYYLGLQSNTPTLRLRLKE